VGRADVAVVGREHDVERRTRIERFRTLMAGLAPTGRFIAHALEMCMAMCLGAVTLNVLIWGGAELLGYTDLTRRFAELSALVVALTLSLPMAAWMRFRGHEWRHTLEMSGATVVVGLLLIGGFWLGIVTQSGLIDWQLRLACPLMFAVMLCRVGLYSQGHAAHHAAHAVHITT
jgi:hypothetical protein